MNLGTLIDGTDVPPGTPVYVRMRHRDIYGNLSLPSTATSVVLRYTNKHPGAKVFFIDSSGTVLFRKSCWTPFPFNDEVSSPAFDAYGNFTTASLNSASATCLSGISTTLLAGTHAYWRMPCNGLVDVVGRIGLRNSCYGDDPKSDVSVGVGVLLVGSGMYHGQPTVAFYRHGEPAMNRDGKHFAATAGATGPTYNLVGNTGVPGGDSSSSQLFFNFSTRITAHSGDFVCPAVLTDGTATGVGPTPNAVVDGVATSWVRFSVLQD